MLMRRTLQELDDAKRTIEELEDELKAQRTRMRSMTTEQSRAERERESVLMKLKRTEGEIVDVKNELQRLKANNNGLESELRRTYFHQLGTDESVVLMMYMYSEHCGGAEGTVA